jgi:hypothetical protein
MQFQSLVSHSALLSLAVVASLPRLLMLLQQPNQRCCLHRLSIDLNGGSTASESFELLFQANFGMDGIGGDAGSSVSRMIRATSGSRPQPSLTTIFEQCRRRMFRLRAAFARGCATRVASGSRLV